MQQQSEREDACPSARDVLEDAKLLHKARARHAVRASKLVCLQLYACLLCHRAQQHGRLQGLSAETLLSSAGGEDGAEVRRVLGAPNTQANCALPQTAGRAGAGREARQQRADGGVREREGEGGGGA